jgi:DNA-directed RNA polymerase III subunit RPC3
MMPLKEARQLLADLQQMHLIETSEISKFPGAKRQIVTVQSEHHLWKIDLAKAYTALLTQMYKTLGNIMQRRATERTKRAGAIAREELVLRKGGSRDLLSTKDRDDLGELDDVLVKLALAESRCEQTVFILRDLPGWPRSKAAAE